MTTVVTPSLRRAHKEILFFASPFFEAALSGHWLETGRPASIASSVITISQPTFPEDPRSSSTARHDVLHSSSTSNPCLPKPGSEQDDFGVFHMSEDEDSGTDGCDKVDDSTSGKIKEQARHQSLQQLEGSSVLRRPGPKIDRSRRSNARALDAHIELKEEKARTFHDFLKFVYPHLDCVITWNNVEGLMNISHKLVVPALQTACLDFLLSHAAGKPIKAMRIAELFNEDELYRESSRFVLDNPGGWPETEMRTLSQETLLKLEKRRNWFLERVLKLGLVTIAKEYQCCATCPDPPNCARLLDEKWRQNYHALFRFGPAQPSMVFRYLRQLEGVSPPLGLAHYSCQLAAKIWVSTLFDRMFSLGIRNSTDLVPPDPRVPNAGPGPRRHFLYCSLHDDNRRSVHRPRNTT